MAQALLEVTNMSVAIGGTTILDDVTFEIASGECVALVGETGSGKTMTVRTITGLVARSGGRVTGGTVRFDGSDLVGADDATWSRLRGRRVGLVPQSSLASLNPVVKVGRQVRETVKVLNPKCDTRERSIELLTMAGLQRAKDVMDLYPHELSGGMRQRVMIALALAGSPDLLIADEATTALDTTIQRGILDLIAGLRESTGMAVLFVTHDLALVRRYTDRVAVMYGGSVVEEGLSARVLDAPQHPYTRALLAATPGVADSRGSLISIPGAPPSPDTRPSGCAFAPRCSRVQQRCRERRPLLTREGPSGEQRSVACWVVAE